MLFKTLMGHLAATGFLMSTSVQAATNNENCWKADEVRAVRILHLQNVLLIDALKCRDTLPMTLESYNGFVSKQHAAVLSSKRVTQARFVRLLGPEAGSKAATDYDTQIGNQLSATPIDVQRCESSGMYARLAASASEDDLVTLADLLATSVHVDECAIADAKPAKPTKMVIAVWDKPAVPAAATPVAPAAAIAPIVAAATPVSPVGAPVAPDPAHAAAPVAPPSAAVVAPAIAATAPAAPAPAPDRGEAVKALQAAVLALNTVAQSLAQEPRPNANLRQ